MQDVSVGHVAAIARPPRDGAKGNASRGVCVHKSYSYAVRDGPSDVYPALRVSSFPDPAVSRQKKEKKRKGIKKNRQQRRGKEDLERGHDPR